jgi:hypothetical protein
MRGFPDLPSREPMKAKFYEGQLWKSELESVLMPMLEKYEVVLLEDTEGLVHWNSDSSPATFNGSAPPPFTISRNDP